MDSSQRPHRGQQQRGHAVDGPLADCLGRNVEMRNQLGAANPIDGWGVWVLFHSPYLR